MFAESNSRSATVSEEAESSELEDSAAVTGAGSKDAWISKLAEVNARLCCF